MRRTITYYLDTDIEQRLDTRPPLNDREVVIISAQSGQRQVAFYPIDPNDDPYGVKVILNGNFSYKTTNPITLADLNPSSENYVAGWDLYIERGGNYYLYWSINYSEPFPLAYTDMEAAITEFSVDDEVICLAPSAQNDVIYTYGGDDRIKPLRGNDYVNGGDGIDTLILTGKHADYRITKDYDRYVITDSTPSRDGTDTITSVERIEFSDKSFAFDMDGNAGIVAKILGAVFGVSSLANETYVGIGLDLLDDGMSYAMLIDLALQVKLGAGYSLASAVNLMETHVYGLAATTAVQSQWANRGLSKEWVAINYAECEVNIDNIDLVGLSQTGIEYI